MSRLLSILMLFLSLLAQSQGLGFYDSLTYAQYQTRDYKALKSTGREALQKGYDFYYLRMRIGIALYETGRYGSAIRHFKVAYSMSTDKLVAEYLYYSLLWSGRSAEARAFLCENRELLSSIPTTCNQFISGIYTEGGVKKRTGDVPEIGDISFYHIGFNHQPAGRLNIYQGYSRIKQEIYFFDTLTINTGGQGQGPGSGSQSESRIVQTETSIIQNEYYTSLSYLPADMISITPAFHYQGVNIGANNKAFSVRIDLRGSSINGYLGSTWSEINTNNQQLYTAGLTLFPLGNQALYLNADINDHAQDGYHTKVYNSRIGFWLFNTIQLEGMYGWGDLYNYPDLNAFYIYNLLDVIQQRMNASASVLIAKKHQLKVGYLLEDKYNVATDKNYEHRGIFVSLNILL